MQISLVILNGIRQYNQIIRNSVATFNQLPASQNKESLETKPLLLLITVFISHSTNRFIYNTTISTYSLKGLIYMSLPTKSHNSFSGEIPRNREYSRSYFYYLLNGSYRYCICMSVARRDFQWKWFENMFHFGKLYCSRHAMITYPLRECTFICNKAFRS